MGASVLILGYSGSGKSTSLQGFEKDEVEIFNVAGKPLPFRNKLNMLQRPTYDEIYAELKGNSKRAYVIDDANFLMAFENFSLSKQKGYEKYTQMAVNFARLLMIANATNEDTIVYFFMHPDVDESGRMKPKSIGKMLDNQLTIEAMFPIVLLAYHDDTGFHFATESTGNDPVKTPVGMFEEPVIKNDLKLVDTVIRDYWGLAPITDAAPEVSTPAKRPKGGDNE